MPPAAPDPRPEGPALPVANLRRAETGPAGVLRGQQWGGRQVLIRQGDPDDSTDRPFAAPRGGGGHASQPLRRPSRRPAARPAHRPARHAGRRRVGQPGVRAAADPVG
ncbi:Conserved oligomeric Golgi complex component 8 [Actinacidiphila bryophytorum]|uniref:Conserved oligomeric Golgi complex component 8 n=1 Tax=Actinacidiphila bryophytorum TaxID=1436133 RepID=A0A9W4E6M8_9ACTN|nr:Conserved oligomeric Golgi complex component 8 [Actinacidiphila bryophytorum]